MPLFFKDRMQLATLEGLSQNVSMDRDLHTERFVLRKMGDEDYDFLEQMYADPDVMKYISTGVRDAQKTHQSLHKFKKHWINYGFGMWTIHAKESFEKLGYMGFRCLEGKEGVEFGGLLVKKIWGKGVATEVGKACIAYGLDHYKFNEIYAVVDPENKASLHWISKLGLKRNSKKDGIYHDTFTYYFSIQRRAL